MVKLDALAAISDTALTRDMAIEMGDNGLPTTFVPGRNLIFLTFAGALAYRRGAGHLVAGMCETDYSGYPDCRDDTIKAMQVALGLGMDRRFVLHTPLMWIDKAGTFALAEQIGGKALLDLVIEETHSCYLGDRDPSPRLGLRLRHVSGVQAAGGWFRAISFRRENEQRQAPVDRRDRVPDRLRSDHSGRQLDDRQRRHRVRAERAVPDSGRAGPDGAIGRG